MVDENRWGRPEDKNFRRRFIRQVRYEGLAVEVHISITEIVLELFRQMNAAYLEIPGATRGWSDSPVELESTGRSLWVPIPGNGEWPPQVLAAGHALGFAFDDAHNVRYVGSLLDADIMTRSIVERRTTAIDSIQSSMVEIYRPGTRKLGLGAFGPDVQFLQLFMFDESENAIFGKSLEAKVRDFQIARGLPANGVLDEAAWLSMFPERTVQVGPGDGGMWVRMVQALLVALDYSSTPVTSAYGTRTTRDVRLMQEANGLRVTGFVRGPEWGVMVHRPVDGFPLG